MSISKELEDVNGNKIIMVRGDIRLFKITVRDDLTKLPQFINTLTDFRVGIKSTVLVDGVALYEANFAAGVTILDTGAEDANKGRVNVTIDLTGAAIAALFLSNTRLIKTVIEFTAVDASTNEATIQQSPLVICRDVNVIVP